MVTKSKPVLPKKTSSARVVQEVLNDVESGAERVLGRWLYQQVTQCRNMRLAGKKRLVAQKSDHILRVILQMTY